MTKHWLKGSKKQDMNDAELVNALEDAIAGLQWMSESDYPLTVLYWEPQALETLTTARLLQLTNRPPDAIVAIDDLETVFAVATQAQDWHDPETAASVKRYQALASLLKQHLRELTVYRVGTLTIDLYIIGKTAIGAIAGLATKAVET